MEKNIVCDRCGHAQRFSPCIEQMKDGVERVYIMCESCKKQYTAYYTDQSIRKIQERQGRIWELISSERGEKYRDLWKEYEINKKKLRIMMFELSRRMEMEYPPG